MKQRVNHWRQPLFAWCVALSMVVFLFAMNGIVPFGDKNLLIGDLGAQYTAFFTGFVRLVHQHVWSVYNFQQALGASWVPVTAYYLMSPFNLLLFFFHSSQIPIAIAIIIMLKIATIAATMTFYLQEHTHRYDHYLWIFGVAFAFSGFVAANFFNVMWLDGLIWLPLVTWGIDQLIRTGKGRAYFWSLFFSIVINYYLGYMTCLFVIGYFIYQLGTTTDSKFDRLWWREQKATIYRFIATSLLSGLTTLFLLLPTALGMLEAPKVSTGNGKFGISPLFGLEFISQFQLGSSNFLQRLMHGPAVFVSSLVVLLALTYFSLPQVKRREKWFALGLLVYLFLGMWIRGFNTVWHMLAEPASYPFRNSFFFSFILILLAVKAWQSDRSLIKRRWHWILPIGFAILMVLGVVMLPLLAKSNLSGYAFRLQPWNWTGLTISVVMLLVVAGLLWNVGPRYQWTMLVLVILELVGNFSWALNGSDYGSQRRYAAAYQHATARLHSVTTSNQLYRIRNNVSMLQDGFAGHYNPYNDPIWLGYNGTNAYSSTTQTTTINMARQLGMYVKNDRRLSNVGFTPVTETLWGVKDKLSANDSQRVKSYRGMGFAVSSRLTNVELDHDPLTNQGNILQALLPSSQPYFVPVSRGTDRLKTVPDVNGQAPEYRYKHVWTVTPRANGRVYLVDPTHQSKYQTLSVDHRVIHPRMKVDDSTTIINLGIHPRNKPLLVKFSSHQASTAALRLATLQPQRLARAQRTLNGHQLFLHRLQHHWKTVYVGHVTATKSTPELYLSLPTESGWHVRVDHKKVATRTTLTGMTTVPVTGGTHQVAISYRAPGAVWGLMVSLLSLGGYAVARRQRWL